MDSVPDESDKPLTATYITVILLEAAIILVLWLLGRAFS